MAPSIHLGVLASVILCISSSIVIAKTPSTSSSRPNGVVLPVTKDPSTKQYITQINQSTPLVPIKLVVDLGGESLWVDCDKGYRSSTYKPAYCGSSLCSLVKNGLVCGGECYGNPRPGCNNNTCSVFPENNIAPISTIGELANDVVSVQSSDGRIVSVRRFGFTCGATLLLKGLAKGVKGMAGLGRTGLGMPSQFSQAFRFARKFGVCLSSSATGGVIFFGDIDISKRLTYTPLIRYKGIRYVGGDRTPKYFIGVKGIQMNGNMLPINTTLLKLNKVGNGGAIISTVIPYTALETSIYKVVTNAFVKSVSEIPRIKKPVAPFDVCYNASSFPSSRSVPTIGFVLQNQKTVWTFFGANSMVAVKGGLLCLAFVDGGSGSVPAIAIGGHQLENSILQFDLAKSRLGFLPTTTTCPNFNFTSIAS